MVTAVLEVTVEEEEVMVEVVMVVADMVVADMVVVVVEVVMEAAVVVAEVVVVAALAVDEVALLAEAANFVIRVASCEKYSPASATQEWLNVEHSRLVNEDPCKPKSGSVHADCQCTLLIE